MRHVVALVCVTLLVPFLGRPTASAQQGTTPDEGPPDDVSIAPTSAPSGPTAEGATAGSDEGEAADDADDAAPSGPAGPAAQGATAAAPDFWSGFHFGSYGRVVAASDLRGQTGRQSRIVAFGPRIDEDDSYGEIELRREDRMFGMDTRIVATIAYAGPLFQYDGEFSERIAVRNLFAETNHILVHGLTLWGGSRMVRGDDVYLMNFWPLDNLNLVGGGARYALDDDLELALTVGMSQPNNPFQRQVDLFPARTGFLADEVYVLDRPRTVIAGRATWWPFGRMERNGVKTVLYGEQHLLAAGERRRADGSLEAVPEDSGYVVGAQVGGYLSDDHAFANLFFRYARGLGAYDPLGVPFRTGTVVSTGRAEEIRVALSANWEWRANADVGLGLQLGGWWRLFRDADPAVFARGAISEGALAIRPMIWLGQFAGIATDLSYQAMQTAALDERTGTPEGGSMFKLGFMPFVSPFGRGTYTRPHLRLVYTMSYRDPGARRLYNEADPRSRQELDHFLGLSVEWWFSSSSYSP